MEQMVMIEQYQTDLASVVVQSCSLGKEIAITHNGEVLTLAKIEMSVPKIKNCNAGLLRNYAT